MKKTAEFFGKFAEFLANGIISTPKFMREHWAIITFLTIILMLILAPSKYREYTFTCGAITGYNIGSVKEIIEKNLNCTVTSINLSKAELEKDTMKECLNNEIFWKLEIEEYKLDVFMLKNLKVWNKLDYDQLRMLNFGSFYDDAIKTIDKNVVEERLLILKEDQKYQIKKFNNVYGGTYTYQDNIPPDYLLSTLPSDAISGKSSVTHYLALRERVKTEEDRLGFIAYFETHIEHLIKDKPSYVDNKCINYNREELSTLQHDGCLTDIVREYFVVSYESNVEKNIKYFGKLQFKMVKSYTLFGWSSFTYDLNYLKYQLNEQSMAIADYHLNLCK